MKSERELKCLAAVWTVRGILTSEGFRDFRLQDGLVGWDKEDLEELLDYLKAKETPATVQRLFRSTMADYLMVISSIVK